MFLRVCSSQLKPENPLQPHRTVLLRPSCSRRKKGNKNKKDSTHASQGRTLHRHPSKLEVSGARQWSMHTVYPVWATSQMGWSLERAVDIWQGQAYGMLSLFSGCRVLGSFQNMAAVYNSRIRTTRRSPRKLDARTPNNSGGCGQVRSPPISSGVARSVTCPVAPGWWLDQRCRVIICCWNYIICWFESAVGVLLRCCWPAGLSGLRFTLFQFGGTVRCVCLCRGDASSSSYRRRGVWLYSRAMDSSRVMSTQLPETRSTRRGGLK